MKSKLKLYTSHCTQISKQSKKSDWNLKDNENQNIYTFPKEWDEKMVFSVLDFAKKYELLAFNQGIEYGKNLNPNRIKALEEIVRNLKLENNNLLTENERIGSKLDELLTFNEN